MSADATGWAFRHSPLTGADLCVHLAIADSVNDQHRNEFWMAMENLAKKARVHRVTAQRCVHRMVDMGLLALVSGPGPKDKRRPSCYRFLFPELPVVFNSRHTEDESASPVVASGYNSRRPDVAPRSPVVASGYNPDVAPRAASCSEGLHKPKETTQEGTQAENARSAGPPVDSFDQFWDRYPTRNGKKPSKATARTVWNRLHTLERCLVLRGVDNYRAAIDAGLPFGVKDAHRWLRDRCWEDWQEPAIPDPPKRQPPPTGPRLIPNDETWGSVAL